MITHISNQSIQAIQNGYRNSLLNDLDHLSEIGLRAVEESKLTLSSQILKTFPHILKFFFDASKNFGHISQGAQGEEESSFIVFYLLQRFELINDRALNARQETVCRQMIMTMGRLIIHCAKFDLSMVSFPTHFITKFGLKAQQHHFDEVTILTTSTILEIGKTILTEIDTTHAKLQESFQALINGLTAIAKGTFKKYKDTSIKVLIQPLIDLKGLFETEKMAHHQDTPTIVQQIHNVLDEFSALEQILQTLPPISDIGRPEKPIV